MNTGKLVRMNRIFSHPSGRLCSVAVDHLMGYGAGLPAGLRHIGTTLAAVVAARPDAVTMHKGIAASAWRPYAGRLPMIIQSTGARPDDTAREQFADPLDAVRLGADAVAVAAFIRGETEGPALRAVADCVRQAAAFDMPVICHIYPRDKNKAISFAPEDIAWAARCAVEVGADVVKTPYCGDVAAYRPDRRRLPRAAGCRRRPEGQHAPRGVGDVRPGCRSGARGAHHRPKHLGLRADRRGGSCLQGGHSRRQERRRSSQAGRAGRNGRRQTVICPEGNLTRNSTQWRIVRWRDRLRCVRANGPICRWKRCAPRPRISASTASNFAAAAIISTSPRRCPTRTTATSSGKRWPNTACRCFR